jgi:hypothetical protein
VQLKVSGTGRLVAAAGVLAVATAGAVIARADDPPAHTAQSEGGLWVSPAGIERQAAAGVANPVTVANRSRETLTITVNARPWTQSSSGSTSPNRRRSLRGVTVSDKEFTLAPGATKDLTVTQTSGSSLFGALEVIGLPRDAEDEKGIVAGYRIVGALRYNPAAPTYKLSAGKAKISKRFIVLPVRNSGNTVESVMGSVSVKGPTGLRRDSIESTRILPRKRVSIPLMSTKRLTAGRYRVTVTLRQGDQRFEVTKRVRVRR